MGAEPDGNVQLHEFLAEIAKGTDFPALSRSIEQILLRASEEAPLQDLIDVILKDFSITLKLLRTANSAIYNRSGKPILSISHAVTLLGVEAVCKMVAGLMVVEHFRKRSPGLKELIVLSLLSANHAREVAERVGYPRLEEAYLCGMFCNLGEILIACYRPKEYAVILMRVHNDSVPVAQACTEILGFTYEQAGVAVASHWQIPKNVRSAMTNPVIRLRRPGLAAQDQLDAIAHFAHKLTNAVYRREPQAARSSVNLLVNSFGPVLGLTHDVIKQIVEASLEETRELFSTMGVGIDHLRLRKQTESALAGEELVERALLHQ